MVERFKASIALVDSAAPPSKQQEKRKPGFQKGNTYAKGRPKGVPNKLNKLVKDSMSGALEKLGALEPIWQYTGVGKNKRKDRIIGWKPTGEGGAEGYLIWLGCNYPTAFATLIGKMMPLQVGISATVDHTVTSKFSDVDIGRMSLTEKLAAFKDMIGATRALPPPENNLPGMIEGEIINREED
jgi:hypothetical protein